MRSLLLLAPRMDGPVGGRYNSRWPDELDQMVERNRWRVVTPALLVLAAIARQEGFDVTVIDEDFRRVPRGAPFDLVCLYTVTPNAKRAYRYADIYRRRGSWVALGGVHAPAMPQESRRHADTLLVGEGEYIFRTFLRDYLQGRARAVYRQPQATVALQASPCPSYELLHREEQRLVPLQTARGCPHACRFCNVRGLYGPGLRAKTEAQINDELQAIVRLPEVRRLYLTDDNLYADRDHARLMMKLLAHTGLCWYANTDITFGAPDSPLRIAYQSGLRQVLIGLESVIPQDLYGIDKGNFKSRHVQRYAEYVARIQSQGIGVTGSFIVGRVHDTADTFERLAEFIDHTHLYAANITMYTPYPGTPLYRQMQREDRLLTRDWNDYTIFQPVIRTEDLSTDTLNELYTALLWRVNTGEIRRRKLRYWMTVQTNRRDAL